MKNIILFDTPQQHLELLPLAFTAPSPTYAWVSSP